MLEFLARYEVVLIGYGVMCVLAIAGAFICGFMLGFRFKRNIERTDTLLGKASNLKPIIRTDVDEAELEERQREGW